MIFTLDISKNNEMKDYEFELQGMDNFLYTKAFTSFGAEKDYKTFAKEILKETIVTPLEARSVDFFSEDFEGLTLIVEKIMELQEGLMKPKQKRKGIRVK